MHNIYAFASLYPPSPYLLHFVSLPAARFLRRAALRALQVRSGCGYLRPDCRRVYLQSWTGR